jgi:hypothetical protein
MPPHQIQHVGEVREHLENHGLCAVAGLLITWCVYIAQSVSQHPRAFIFAHQMENKCPDRKYE